MELVNKEYIKISKFGIFTEIVRASDEEDNNKLNFFQNLLHIVMDYEKENKTHTEDIYIRISDLQDSEILKISEIPIARQTIMNASLFAIYSNELDIARKLTLFFSKREILPNELGNLLDYVLKHGIDMNEYLNSKYLNITKEYLIYNEKDNTLEEGYIYQKNPNSELNKISRKLTPSKQ